MPAAMMIPISKAIVKVVAGRTMQTLLGWADAHGRGLTIARACKDKHCIA